MAQRYLTVMFIPDRDKETRSWRVPRPVFWGLGLFLTLSSLMVSVMVYDYWQVLKQVYLNKHLALENRELKEQLQVFQMKMNSLNKDIERMSILEGKLRVITGLESSTKNETPERSPQSEESATTITPPADPLPDDLHQEKANIQASEAYSSHEDSLRPAYVQKLDALENDPEYLQLKVLFEKKMLATIGAEATYQQAGPFALVIARSMDLARLFAKIDFTMSVLRDYSAVVEQRLHQLDRHLLDRQSFLDSTPTLMPTKGWITSYYGPRHSPYSSRIKMHEGLDIGSRPGTPIYGPADGVVTFSGSKPGFGNIVQIDHGYGMETIYAHASNLTVKKGQVIKRGDMIARVGSTGLSTGPHLHYEVRVNGTPVDPLYFILD
jgi:murein DD-endopeptidase MepM/ murein hydrolase activator NlpD